MKRTRPRTIAPVSLALAAVVFATGCGDAEDPAEGGPSSAESPEPPPTTPATASGHELCQPTETTGVDNTDTPDVTVGTVTRNPRGPQTAAALNNEVVTLTSSTSERAIDLTGWTVEDDQGVSFTFPRGSSICRYVVISIHSGRGTDTKQDFFADWGWRWDNDGDTVTLRDAEHVIVAECSYGETAPALHC